VLEPADASHYQRRAPTIPVTITGAAGATLAVGVDGQTFTLAESTRPTIACSNGARLRVDWNRPTGEFRCEIERGAFQFRIAGIPGWHALGLSDQASAFQWDLVNGAVDIHNRSTIDPLLVVLSSHSLVSISPGAAFQLKRLNDGVFSTAAAAARWC